jgi:hypothetical protein
MKYLLVLLTSFALFFVSVMPLDAAAGLRDRERPDRTPDRGGKLDPRGVADPRGKNDPRSDNLDENRESWQDTYEQNSDNREDARGEGDDEREDAFEQNQENREDNFDDASENREQGREEYADELEDMGDDIRDGDEILDDDLEFRGDGDGLIDGDGYESDDNDLLKIMAIGAMANSLPQNAQPQSVNGSDYYFDGTTWYKPVTTPSGTSYEVVPAPWFWSRSQRVLATNDAAAIQPR